MWCSNWTTWHIFIGKTYHVVSKLDHMVHLMVERISDGYYRSVPTAASNSAQDENRAALAPMHDSAVSL